MNVQIRHRHTNAVLFETAVPDDDAYPIRTAVTAAIAAGADLAGANLAGANLAGADLADADLARADLAGANLAGAYLAGANLAGAYLAGAYLARADLADADLAGADLADASLAGADLADADLADASLAGADLADADLADADLAGADLADANLAGADLADANLAGARNVPASVTPTDPPEPYVRAATPVSLVERARRFRERHPEVPVVEQLDAKILALVDGGQGQLEMATWHTCETTHCLGGWSVALAGEAGRELERRMGTAHAAAMIYRASTGHVPHFYATNERALEALRQRAAEQTATTAQPSA